MTAKRRSAGRLRSFFRGAFVALLLLPNRCFPLRSPRSPRLMPLLFFAFCLSACTKTDNGAAATAPPIIKTPAGDAMALVPAGWFEMGSAGRKGDESPVHKVWVDGFLMDVHEVTQAQYGRAGPREPIALQGPAGGRSNRSVGPRRPSTATSAPGPRASSRATTRTPARATSRRTGTACPPRPSGNTRAARGRGPSGTSAPDAAPLADYAWFAENSAKATHPVGGKTPECLGPLRHVWQCGRVVQRRVRRGVL